MLDYTRAIFTKTKKDFDFTVTLFQFVTQIVYILYLVFCVFSKNNSIWYLHLTLLLISAAFLVFDAITFNGIKIAQNEQIPTSQKKEKSKRIKSIKKRRSNVRKVKFYVSHFLRTLVLLSAFYPIIVSPYSVHPLSIMCTTLMVTLWLAQILLEIVRVVFEKRLDLIIEALKADIEFVTKPVSAVKNTVGRIFGKEPTPEPEPSKERVYLDGLVTKRREEKAEQKATAKAERNEKISSWLDQHLAKFTKKRERDEEDIDVSDYSVKDEDPN